MGGLKYLAAAVAAGVLSMHSGAAGAAEAEAGAPMISVSAPTQLGAAASPGVYYVRVVIEPEFDAAALAAIQNEKRSPFQHIAWKKSRGFSLLPEVKVDVVGSATQNTIPTVPILYLGAADANDKKAPWSSQDTRRLTTPWVRLDANTSINVVLKMQGFEAKEWALFSNALPPALAAYSGFGGQWPKVITNDAILAGGGGLDALVNLFQDSAVNRPRAVSNQLTLDPLGNGRVGYTVDLRNPAAGAHPVIGRAKVYLDFQRSFAVASTRAMGLPDAVGPFTPTPVLGPQLFQVKSTNALGQFDQQPFYLAIKAAVENPKTRADQFKARCDEFRNGALSMAMTHFDAGVGLWDAVESANWANRPDLIDRGCFNATEISDLKTAGHAVRGRIWPPSDGDVLAMSKPQFDGVGAYLVKGAAATDTDLAAAKQRFADAVYFEVQEAVNLGDVRDGAPVSPDDALSTIAGGGVDRVCCRGVPTGAAQGAARQEALLLKPDPALGRATFGVAIAEYRTTTMSGDKVGRVLVRAATAAESASSVAKICGGPNAPAYLACAGATTQVAEAPKPAEQLAVAEAARRGN